MSTGTTNGTRVLVTGSGGFIGNAWVTYLARQGYWVRGVDIKRPELSESDAAEFEVLDLRRWENCLEATRGVDEVYALAAYGWEKLIAERVCEHYREDYGIETRIVRFRNIFGPLGTWEGGREKVPAALCRKVAMAKLTGSPEIGIIHRDRWWEIGGYDARFIYMDWQEVDMILRLDAEHTFVNLGEVVDHDFYHLDHAHPRGAWEAARNRKTNPVRDYDHRPPEIRPNDESWGLARHPLACVPCDATAEPSPLANAPPSPADWLRFLALVGATGAQIAWDHSLLALASLRRRLSESASLWEARIGQARDRIRGEPATRWPALLASLFLEKVRSRVREGRS